VSHEHAPYLSVMFHSVSCYLPLSCAGGILSKQLPIFLLAIWAGVGASSLVGETCGTSVLQRQHRSSPVDFLRGAEISTLQWSSTLNGSLGTRLQGEYAESGLNAISWIFLHIPKCAGSSTEYALFAAGRTRIPAEHGHWSSQDCIPSIYEMTSTKIDGDRRYVVMLREPRSHVQSLFYFCRDSRWGLSRTKEWQSDPALMDFTSWLSYYNDGSYDRTQNSFDCYSPLNYQARHFSCSGEGITGSGPSPIAEEAIDAMNAVDLVGIVERYQESMCLFASTYMAALPPSCNCEDKEAWESFPRLSKENQGHGAAKHIGLEMTSHDIEMIDNMNQADTVLYRAAVQRFLNAIDIAEQKHGVRILCDRKIQA